jgi:ArsR family transcriptional regulator, arsenate/arsenite/antimonite-responsive transcriptional repressor
MPRMARSNDPDVRMLAALADPARLAIVRQLATDGPVCACDFAAGGDLSQPTVSHHLRVLREAGIVHGERRGTWIWYRLDPSVADRLVAIAGQLGSAGPARPASALGSPTATRARRLPVVDPGVALPAGERA